MSRDLKSCLITGQDDFYYDVKIGDDFYGRARVLSSHDKSIIRKKSTYMKENDGTPIYEEIIVDAFTDSKGEYHPQVKRRIPVTDLDNDQLIDWFILLSFGGKDGLSSFKLAKDSTEAWDFDDACTLANIRLIYPAVKRELFNIMEKKNGEFAENSEVLLKNLEKQSD